MAKTKKNKVFESWQTNGHSNFMQIFHDLFDSKAWQELNAHDCFLYLHMLRKHQRNVIKGGYIEKSNCDDISMPKSEYEKFMNQRTFYKSIDKLIELGFVKVIRNGYAAKICNIYGFSDMWKVYGTKGFEVKEEFKRLSKQKI